MKKILILILVVFFTKNLIIAQKTDIEKSGDLLQIAIPSVAFLSTILKKDKQKGTLQFTKALGTTIVITHILKKVIDKKRPYGGHFGFPSGHTSSAFTGAAFLQKKYGWQFGVPAYLLAGYVGWSRVNANKHDYWDVLGGAIIGIYTVYVFTKPNKKDNIEFSISKFDNYYLVGFTYNF